MNLQELIAKIVTDAKGDIVAVAYEGNKVEYEGEVWYELTIKDHGGVFVGWYADLDGEAVFYDQSHIGHEDRIPEIDAAIAKRDAD